MPAKIGFVLCVLLLLLGGPVPAAAEAPSDDLVGQLQRQLVAGDHVAALTTARALVVVRPRLTGAWYNLAGLEAQEGTLAAAEEAFARAVQLGFDDFRHADQDLDLAGLRGTNTYRRLRDAWSDGLGTRARACGLELTAGAWSDPIVLADRFGGLFPPEAELRLRVDADGLELEVLLGDETLPPTAPWQRGGSGVLVSVTLPAEGVEGTLHRDFGFGWLDKLPAGALLLDGRWQPLAQLSPKLRVDHGRSRLRLTAPIPWATCGSLHPLVDETLLVNVSYVRGHGENPGRASLITDPALGRPDRLWRRGAPLRVRWRDDQPAIAGRLDDLVVREAAIPLHLGATLPRPGSVGDLHLVLRDRRSEVVADVDEQLSSRRLDTTLPAPTVAGSALLGVSLGVGRQRGLASWEQAVLVLPPGWAERVEATIASAPVRERPSLRYRQRAITATLEERHPRQEIHALGGTVDELEAMLAAVETRGTSLPAGGTYLAALPSEDGSDEAVCSLALPAGWQRGDQVTVVMLLARAPGAAERAVRRAPLLLRELAGGGAPAPVVLAIPRLGTTHDHDDARDRAGHLVEWLREFLGVDRVLVAGVDLLAATALELAADRPGSIAGVLAITGVNFVPYPRQSDSWIGERLGSIPTDLPAGWLWFPDEIHGEDQSRSIRRVLTASGRVLDPAEPIPGGLSFDQAWSRAVVWAADLEQD